MRAVAPDHGGQIVAAARRWGGDPQNWLDLSTGINPEPYPVPEIPASDWANLPDPTRLETLCAAARAFWNVPDSLAICAAPGASALIARLPSVLEGEKVSIPAPTYNEHAIAFRQHGWHVREGDAPTQVLVHPNNPDGRIWRASDLENHFTIIDESFCDVMPHVSLLAELGAQQGVVLKSFGKFWGLAGVRLGFAIGEPSLIEALSEALGPWPITGPTLTIAQAALEDHRWARATREKLAASATRLDALMAPHVAGVVGGTSLFRLYTCEDATKLYETLAESHILARVFPYNPNWIRFGLPPENGWARLEAALS